MNAARTSRFWQAAQEYQRLGAALVVVLVIAAFKEPTTSVDDVVGPLMIMFGGVGSVIYAGAAWVNRSERDPGFQAALAAREQAAAPLPPPESPPRAAWVPSGEDLLPSVSQGRPS